MAHASVCESYKLNELISMAILVNLLKMDKRIDDHHYEIRQLTLTAKIQ